MQPLAGTVRGLHLPGCSEPPLRRDPGAHGGGDSYLTEVAPPPAAARCSGGPWTGTPGGRQEPGPRSPPPGPRLLLLAPRRPLRTPAGRAPPSRACQSRAGRLCGGAAGAAGLRPTPPPLSAIVPGPGPERGCGRGPNSPAPRKMPDQALQQMLDRYEQRRAGNGRPPSWACPCWPRGPESTGPGARREFHLPGARRGAPSLELAVKGRLGERSGS